jgi:ferritin-like metal-binding protein YciE
MTIISPDHDSGHYIPPSAFLFLYKKRVMKKSLVNLQDALAYLVTRLYNAERKSQKVIEDCSVHITSLKLKKEIQKYRESTSDKLTKLERVFNYLMQEPEHQDNEVMDKMLEDLYQTITHTSDALRDAMIISCLQQINHYKIAGYGTARAMALELELETVGDLFTDILRWEKQSDRAFTHIALGETNLKAAQPSELITA